VTVDLVLLTYCASCNIIPDEGIKAGPPVIAPDEFQRSQLAGMTRRDSVVVALNNVPSEIQVIGDIATVLIEYQAVVVNSPISGC
jgi:hypothetical protein